MVEDLPVGYYLDNFSYVLDYVADRYADILTEEELDYRRRFQVLSRDARRLYVRLAGRKGPLFRDDKLDYAEIPAIGRAVEELLGAGYCDGAGDADISDLLNLLTRAELAALPSPDTTRSMSRAELAGCLAASMTEDALREHVTFRVIRPLKLDALQVYKLLFFGNLHQDFTEFVLHDLGISPYEPYRIDPEDRFFDDRAVLEATLELYAAGEAAQEVVACGDVESLTAFARSLPAVDDERLQRRAGKVRNLVARQLERLEALEDAMYLYRTSDVSPSRERRARILARTGDGDGAIALCREIAAEPEDEAEYEFAVGFARRTARRIGCDCTDLPEPGVDDFSACHITIRPDDGQRVEELARRWFESNGNRAWYVENGFFPSLFGLSFWDIIFHPIKGAFFNPFQRGPADLFTAAFREARRDMIEARFEELAGPDRLRQRVLETFYDKSPTANHFVHWGVLDEELLEMAFDRVPVEHILAVFRRLLRDLRSNRSGFPDLLIYPDDGGYHLGEVKGPGDTLQNNQRRWLRFFARQRIPASVVHVDWHAG